MQPSKILAAILAIALCAGVVLRCAIHPGLGLWEDEIIAVTHAVQTIPVLLVNVLRNDIHPPLYFLQLHVWGWASHADTWFILNSVTLGLAALASLWLALRRLDGPVLAWTATACLAVLPSGLWMSQEVRPYAWLSILHIWSYAAARAAFATPDADPRVRRRAHLALFGLSVAIIYSHAIGFFAVLFFGLYGMFLLASRRAGWRAWRNWATVFGLAALASVPILASNLLHDANLDGRASWADIFVWCASIVTVREAHGVFLWSSFAVWLGVAACGLALRRTRVLSFCFLIAPLLAAAILGATVKPIFKANFFATLMAPFLAVILAHLLLALREDRRAPVAGACLAGLFGLAFAGWSDQSPITNYRGVAAFIRAAPRMDGAVGDAVWAPQPSMFWGLAHYLAGPDWGSPLAIAPMPNAAWSRIYDRLGPRLVAALGLQPATQSLTVPADDGHGALTLLIGPAEAQAAATHPRVWLATVPRADLPPGLPPETIGALHKISETRWPGFTLTRYE